MNKVHIQQEKPDCFVFYIDHHFLLLGSKTMCSAGMLLETNLLVNKNMGLYHKINYSMDTLTKIQNAMLSTYLFSVTFYFFNTLSITFTKTFHQNFQ